MSDSLWPHELQHISFPTLHHLPELAQTHVHWVGDAIQAARPLLSPSLTAFNLSPHQSLFHWVHSSYQVATYWSFSFSISPSNEYSGLISFGITGFISLLSKGLSRVFSSTTVQKVLILWHLAFFLVQLSHLCITTRKTIALTIRTFVSKIMSLLFNMLSSI